MNKEKKHGFKPGFVPLPWYGRLKSAPIVLAYTNPGLSKGDAVEARDPHLRKLEIAQRTGNRPLLTRGQHPRRAQWIAARTWRIGEYEDLRSLVAVIELFAYRSRGFGDQGLVNILPSAEMARRYLKEVLVPEAKAGRLFLIVARARKLWGISKADECHTLRVLENRGGYLTEKIANYVKKWLCKRGYGERIAKQTQ